MYSKTTTLFRQALNFHQAEQFQEAERLYRLVLLAEPLHAEANHNLGIIAVQVGQVRSALPYLQIALENAPAVAQHWMSYIDAMLMLDMADVAQTILIQGLQQGLPAYVNAYYNLGICFHAQGRYHDAVLNYRKALEVDPQHFKTCNNLGETLSAEGKSDEAIEYFEKALKIKPDYLCAHSNLLLRMQYSKSMTRPQVFARHIAFSTAFEAPLKAGWRIATNVSDPCRRLKIGYVSADFRAHAVASFISPILANHDKDRFDVYCYYNYPHNDVVSERLQMLSDHWFDCTKLTDDQLAERIRVDGIDVLIDLSGHTAGNRLLTFARKPAPVQLTYLGYPGTSGLSAMDYRITDAYADLDGSGQYYAEKLLYLPDSLCCYQPTLGMPDVAPLPALRNGYITFGSFNNSSKIDQCAIDLWAEILRALPSSRLLMATIPLGERGEWVLQQFEQAGVARSRIDLYGTLPMQQFHALYERVDLALDPLLITGGTTTCESLWMGVPVIVMVGQSFIHRVGYSFLCSAGLPHYAAATLDEYVQVALAAAADIPLLAKVRAGMRMQLAASPLMDQVRFTRNFENALRRAWSEWCEIRA
jgi:protein O-GlcNAc transferase